jgi:hypothetical protein
MSETLQDELRHRCQHSTSARDIQLMANAADKIDELEKVLSFIKRGIEANHIKCAPYFDFDPEATSLEFKSVLDLINEVLEPKS